MEYRYINKRHSDIVIPYNPIKKGKTFKSILSGNCKEIMLMLEEPIFHNEEQKLKRLLFEMIGAIIQKERAWE